MTNYPINFSYDRDGAMTDGYAADEVTALAVLRDLLTLGGNAADDLPTSMRLTTHEAGHISRDRQSLETAWAHEIKAGYASVIQVWGGYKIEITTWEGAR